MYTYHCPLTNHIFIYLSHLHLAATSPLHHFTATYPSHPHLATTVHCTVYTILYIQNMHLRTTSQLSHILQLNLAIPILHLSHHITSLPQTSNPPHLQILTTFDDVLYCTVPITKLFIFSEMESRDTLPAAGLVWQLV